MEIIMERYIVTDKDKITRTDTYLVTLTTEDGTVHESLEPRRLFPVSSPDTYLSLLNTEEKEVALIKSINDLEPASREAIEGCFSDFYMIPVIHCVLSVNDKFGMLKWHVLTDRGEIEFDIRNRHSDIKVFKKTRLFVRDSNDNRYVGDLSKFDKKSLNKIFSYL